MGHAEHPSQPWDIAGHADATCCARASIAAARIVAYDSSSRTPLERAHMLKDLGLTRIVWDWREEHALDFPLHLDAFAAAGITITGLWCPLPLAEPDVEGTSVPIGAVPLLVQRCIDELRQRGLTPDLWTCVEFGSEGTPARLSQPGHDARVRRAADHLEPLTQVAREHGMRLALTNHLGWFGEPTNQIDVLTTLRERGFTNVGIAYQMQHGHSHVRRFAEVFRTMQPHLLALALNGMDADAIATGRKILPWGSGRLDRRLAHTVLESGWHGQIVIQGHSMDDAEARLLDNLEGLAWMMDRWRGNPHRRPTPRIPEPAWPEPRHGSGPPVGMTTLSRRARRVFEVGHTRPATLSNPPPEPGATSVELPPGGPDPTEPIPPPRERRRSRSGSAGVALAVQAARERIAADPSLADMPPEAPAASARQHNEAPHDGPGAGIPHVPPLSPIQSSPDSGDTYTPTSAQHLAERHDELPVRIARGDISLEPPDPYTGAIHALLTHLETVGFRGAPRSFGWDAHGRHLVEYVSGMRADHPDAPPEALDPMRVGMFMRDMHDALETFVPPTDARWFDGLPGPEGDLVIHQDIAPSNLVHTPDGLLVAIDWDAAAPGSRLWDIAHAVHALAPLHGSDLDIAGSATRLRAFVDGYGLTFDQREQLLPLLAIRSRRMYEYLDRMRALGEWPWIELWEQGVGTVWQADAAFILEHEPDWKAALLG